ncbi:TetR family transcriptional regulator [Pseudactinotalea sp. Z1739]|uniref:TetR/AcrR family transcriptional regulator n=1 Tax=Pseudactinotalea sp. Z1739 TaxID=3413028 RepID=UPI003C7BCA58
MRSAPQPPRSSTTTGSRSERAAADLTARARLRDAAIEVFGDVGFDASVRAIAARAGVSAALVIHHFGSKEKLRAVCDQHVAALVAEAKQDSVGADPGGTLLSQLAMMDSYAWLVGYIMQSFAGGGALASHLFDIMVADAQEYIAEAVRLGTARESVDPAARAKFLTSTGVGSLLLMMRLEQPGPDADYAALLQRWSAEFMVPALELYSHGFFTDDSVLQTYLDHLAETGAGPANP